MSLFGTFKFGQKKFGEAVNDVLKWGLAVDWTDAGFFSGHNDAYERMVGFHLERGRKHMLNATSQDEGSPGFERQSIGKLRVTLDNIDGRYSTTNTDSPLYGDLERGKFASFLVSDGTTTWNVFTGKFEGVRPVGRGNWERAVLDFKDGNKSLAHAISLAISENQANSDLLDDVLDAADWPSRWGRDIGVSINTTPFYFADSRGARNVMHDLAVAEFGRLWIAADGTVKFRNRHSSMGMATAIGQAEILKNISERPPAETVRNVVKIKSYPKVVQATAQLWALEGETPGLAASGGTYTTWLDYMSGDQFGVPAKDVLTPVAGAAPLDYTANSQPDGLGTDLTASVVVDTFDVFSQSAKLIMKNNHPSSIAYLTYLRVRGDAVTTPNAQFQIGQAGEFATKPRTLIIDIETIQDTIDAEVYADFLADFLSVFDPSPIIELEDRPDLQFGLDLFDTVVLSVPALKISRTYQIGYIVHDSLNEACTAIRTRFHLEPFPVLSNSWIFPTQIGVSSRFTF
jgi:hypothetical protein